MKKINCENRNPKRKIDLSSVERTAKTVLRELGRNGAEINIVFVSSQKIRVLNRRYLGKDTATDVLAFRQDRDPGETCISKDFFGDIIISSDRAARNAKEYGISFEEETALYVIHGILHLSGYEDRTVKGRSRMKRMENDIFKKIRKFFQEKFRT